jgi:hypothetical protein
MLAMLPDSALQVAGDPDVKCAAAAAECREYRRLEDFPQ